MKHYILLSLCIFLGFPVVAMEIDRASSKNKNVHEMQAVVGEIASLHDLCCNAIGEHIATNNKELNFDAVAFSQIPDHCTEKIFNYLLNPEKLNRLIDYWNGLR